MVYAWTDDLATGNPLIDSQHKQWIQSLNNFMDACKSGKGAGEIERTMKFLVDYTAKHFADEEKLQLQHNYPDNPNHKKMHEAFKKVIQDLSDQLKKEGPTVTLTTKIIKTVGDWLINHIKSQDTKVAAHIHSAVAK